MKADLSPTGRAFRCCAESQSSASARALSRLVVLIAVALAACAQTPFQSNPGATSQTGEVACTGSVVVPYGLVEVSDPDMLKTVLQPAGKGGLCEAKVLQVQQPLTVYRVWDSRNLNSQYGRWWSFTPPAGPVNTYRTDNAICPEWSALNQVTQCHLKVGAKIAVGPGQSAQCPSGNVYPQSPANQVFVPNDTRDPGNIKLEVDDCVAGAVWP
ncbi:MAG: hypothetical protein AB1704_29760 [Pseudomonadota bacterium]|uniref:hypothetical protein n=2 Tax=Burkholderiales TaxID=80840 RepID=UPI0010F5796F|nr:hypothetical protein [Burkholderia sp. 4M9327F10]